MRLLTTLTGEKEISILGICTTSLPKVQTKLLLVLFFQLDWDLYVAYVNMYVAYVNNKFHSLKA